MTDYPEPELPAEPTADDEASLVPPSERLAQYLGEISVTIDNRLRAKGHAAAADEIVYILLDMAKEAGQ